VKKEREKYGKYDTHCLYMRGKPKKGRKCGQRVLINTSIRNDEEG
jgi:hypothetical protein